MSAALAIDRVTVRFGGVTAVNAVCARIENGELVGLIGPNGAGKTTLMRAITGVVTPDEGEVTLGGHRLDGLGVHQRVRLGLGFSQQIVQPLASMSLLDNVALAVGLEYTGNPLKALANLSRSAERERALELLARVGIAEVADARPATLPLGYLKRLEMARALAINPRVLLLDEPLAGLNQNEAATLAETIAALNRGGQTVVLIEHNLGEVARICRRLLVLDNGDRIGDGPTEQVLADSRVRAAYLGQ